MSDLVVLALGGAIGVVVGWLASRTFSPLARYQNRQTNLFGVPLSVGEKQMYGHFHKGYFVALPLILGVMFAVVALAMFGGGEWVR